MLLLRFVEALACLYSPEALRNVGDHAASTLLTHSRGKLARLSCEFS
jgi:hypothetical protein